MKGLLHRSMLTVSTATIFYKPHGSGVHYVHPPYLYVARSFYYDQVTQVSILDIDYYG